MNLSYQPVTYSVSTHPNLQFKRWKSRHPTGIHLAVALEVRSFFDVSGYCASSLLDHVGQIQLRRGPGPNANGDTITNVSGMQGKGES